MAQSFRRIVCLLLLAAGAVYWLDVFGWRSLGPIPALAILLALVAAFFPILGLRVIESIDRINAVLVHHRARTAFVAAVLVAIYVLLFDYASRELLFLKFNDEHAYMIQARMLSHGRLWMPAYPPNIAPFFDAIALIGDRVYAAMYFPGTALAMVPFIWLHLPYWLMPLAMASIAAGLCYWLVADLFDPFRGLIAVLILFSLPVYRSVAGFLLSEMPFLAGELILLLAWFRLRRKPSAWASLVLGLSAGYCAITRPLDAVCVALPVGLAIVWQLRSQAAVLTRSLLIILLGACPFLLLLLIQNKGVTGHWDDFAESYYNHQVFPASPMGFHHVTAAQIPKNISPIKRQWLQDWVLENYQRHTPMRAMETWYEGRLRITLEQTLPHPILAILLPAALLALCETRRLVLGAIFVLFCIGYAIYLFFLEHYIISILPSMICLLLMATQIIQQAWPNARRVSAFVLLCIITLSIPEIWPAQPVPPVVPANAPDQRPANALLANLRWTPALVLFKFDPKVSSSHDDPVYNDSVAWPDDAKVIRARDLGPERDREIFRYYAQRQPNRVVYVYDPDSRAEGQFPLTCLGTVRQLVRQITGTTP